MKQKDRQIIIKEINEHHYETVIRPEEDQEAWDKGLSQMYEERAQQKQKVVENYFKANSPETCKKCHINNCLLLDETFGCGYIGKVLEQNLKEGEEYEIVETPKGIWGEIFYPISDEQINNLEAIF